MLPVVLKVLFKLLGHIFGQGPILVEVSKQSKPFAKVLRIFVVSGNLLEVHQDFNELTHDVGETSHSNQQDEGCNDALSLRLRVVISKTNSG